MDPHTLGLAQWLLLCSTGITARMCFHLFSDTLADFRLQAIDIFCVLADENEDIPPLANGKNWSNFKLAGAEWQLIQLAYNCLVVRSDIVTFLLCFHLCWSWILASVHRELSAEKDMPQGLSTTWKDSNGVGGPSRQPLVSSCPRCNTGQFRYYGEMVSKNRWHIYLLC